MAGDGRARNARHLSEVVRGDRARLADRLEDAAAVIVGLSVLRVTANFVAVVGKRDNDVLRRLVVARTDPVSGG